MKAVIMAGGFGTRLRPLTAYVPKPMVPMGNKPILEHTVELLRRHGFEELIVLLHFLPESITNYFGDGADRGVRITYVTPPIDLGTAGAVKYAASGVGEPLLVLSGDVLTDMDLTLAVAFHRGREALATMVLARVENPLPYGIVLTDERGRITRFLEKPTWGEVFSDTINAGIYILEPDALGEVPGGREYDFGKELFPRLLSEGRALFGYVGEGYWKDVGDIQEYRLAQLDILSGKVKCVVPGQRVAGLDRDVWIDEGARVDFTTRLTGAVIVGRDSKVGPNVRLHNTVIGPGSVIEEGAQIQSSVLWEGVHVGPRATMKESVVGRQAIIKAGAFLDVGAVVADHSKVGEGSVLKANAKVWPYKEVEDGAVLSSSLVWGERWSRAIFGRYGVTGLANIEISPEFTSKLGAAFGATLGKRRQVITSRDHHKASRMINRAIMCGFLSAGVDVQDLGVAPIPVARYQIGALGLVGGTHVRISPYDPELIDIKFFDHRGMDLAPDREKAVERFFFREDFYRAPMEEIGSLSFPHPGSERYRDGLLKYVDRETIRRAHLRMVLDYAFGSASTIFPPILGEMGVEAIALNAYLDESKISKTAEEFQRSLHQLSNIVRTLGADIGVLLDTGSEKIFLVDEKGEVIPGELALALMALLTMRTQPKGTIAVPVTASGIIDRLSAEYGFPVVRTRTSPRSLMEQAQQEGIILVGEERGGFIFPRFQPAFDAMLAVGKILEMMAKLEVRLHQLIRSVPQVHLARVDIACPNDRKGLIMRRLIEETQGQSVELVEGVKVHLAEEWVLAVPDPDRALFHVLAEAPSQEAAQRLVDGYAGKIARWREEREA